MEVNNVWPNTAPSLGQFFGLRAQASNLVCPNTSTYTEQMFFEDFPQFTKLVKDEPATDPATYHQEGLIPTPMLDIFIAMANAAVLEKRWFSAWRYAMGLFVAHYSTLYLQSYIPASETSVAADAAGSGAVIGVVKSATLGDSSVSYDTSAITAATEDWGAWNATTYGQQLVTMARLTAMGGTYVI